MAEQKVDLKNLKAGGFIKERGKDLFTVRLRVPGGRMSVDRLSRIAAVAQKYGKGYVHLSVRQSIELININFADFDAVVAELGEEQQKVASCGARVRVPTACGGCEYNPNGLVDTQKSALDVDQKLFGTATGHHKFKVCFAGCPFDCPKSAINDVGFQGAVWPKLDADGCISCGLCAKSCTEGALSMGAGNKPVFDAAKCIYCGDCIKVCPTGAWSAEKKGYTVRIGGKWGRRPLVGTLYATFVPEERVVEFIATVLSWYQEKAEGAGRVRLGDIIIREGWQSLLERLRVDFPEYVVKETIAPQVVQTQLPLPGVQA
ncbi:4Fe-4S dicluster domain-containing protein [Geomonas subterranea]|uniref:4Fe-4S dicluster domain-containing protein n=1 Tax=Geomonas subterranea TaxID=2847989 RepID=A0ABX8LMJ1_9BACT|nr:4Fe-4S dicluster domain-containing protein [Geomonas subterranea]QXE92142.1 4Fe-4S dicluster domain-containing protein [Geomonas subterranea]QXM09760.1 4Fe-4S dicluster domain-containing protein [Geomonas subterranea]